MSLILTCDNRSCPDHSHVHFVFTPTEYDPPRIELPPNWVRALQMLPSTLADVIPDELHFCSLRCLAEYRSANR